MLFVYTTLDIDQTFYPERLGQLFLVNAPWVFKGLWTMIKPWVDPVTVQKFIICSDNGAKELLKEIDAAVLPQVSQDIAHGMF